MPQRDMSQRHQRPDRLRLGRESSTSRAQRKKEAVRPPMAGRGRGGRTRFGRIDAARGSSSQTGPSQMVDSTQYQYQHHQMHDEYQQHYQQETAF